MDISLDRIQKLTEDAVLTGNSDIAIVLNDKGEVIAHSNLKEVGKNYYAETDTLGAKIINSLNSSKDYVAIDFQGSHYIVYMAKIQNGWYCISDCFVDHDGYSISSEGFLPTVVDIRVI